MSVVSLDHMSLTAYSHIIDAYPYKPFYYYSALTNEAMTGYMLEEMTQAIETGSNWGIGFIKSEHPRGLVICGRRAWETNVLGIEAGFIGPLMVDETDPSAHEVRQVLLARALNRLTQEGIVHVTIRLDMNEVRLLHLLEEQGFLTMDGILHFSLDLRRKNLGLLAKNPENGIEYRLHLESDVAELCHIAQRTLLTDRFHADPFLSPAVVKQVYPSWVNNACHGMDDAVIVAVRGNTPVGFFTARIAPRTKPLFGVTVGKIWLGSVSDSVRGLRVGEQLMYHTMQWFSQHGVDIVEAGTQLCNVPGLKMYTRLGFTPINPVMALRKVLGRRESSAA